MSIARVGKHLLANRSRVRKAFPPNALAAIEKAIKRGEQGHAGQIRFVVEGALHGAPLFNGQSARARALDVFSQLRIWDTEHNNGVLIYLLLADRNVEIVADRGVDARVGAQSWEAICRTMEMEFRGGHFEHGAIAGISAVADHLAQHFPNDDAGTNELPDAPVLL